MKKCATCKQEKSLEEFNKNKTRKDGYQTLCKECNRERSKKYYIENIDKHKKAISNRKYKYRQQLQQLADSYKKECSVCYEDYPKALDFHHIDKKITSISNACGRLKNKEFIIKEITKCIVLCSNCHRKYHDKHFCLLLDKNTKC